MLIDAARKYDLSLVVSLMVGDRAKDIEAGRRAGCRTIFIDHGYREPRPEPAADFTTHSLLEAAGWILKEKEQEKTEETKNKPGSEIRATDETRIKHSFFPSSVRASSVA